MLFAYKAPGGSEKVTMFGVKSTNVLREQMGTNNLLK